MDFFKLKKFRNAHKPNATQDQTVPQPGEPKNASGHHILSKSFNIMDSNNNNNNNNNNAETEDDDDDDFITNEVKRRLKELRRNSFMVLIPEETSPADDGEEVEDEEKEEDEEEGETCSSEWRDVEAEGRQFWSGFDAVYDIYSERMLFLDRSSSQQLLQVASHNVLSTPSPRSASKKLGSPFGCLSLKKIEAPEEETEHLQQPANDPYQDLETAYVGQVCLTWEALHCQYTQLSQKIACQPESLTSYSHSTQQFQQFQVLLQRFIENEPFEMGSRPEIYARTRKSLPKLLQVPKVQASDEKNTRGETSDLVVLGTDLIGVIESSIICFRQFIKMDKKKSGGVRGIFGSQNQMTTPAQQVQSSLEKKAMKVKELWKRSRSYKKKSSWPTTAEDVELLLGVIDVKVLSRVLRMLRISKQELFWCEEKMKKLCISNGNKLQRDPSPIIFFPC